MINKTKRIYLDTSIFGGYFDKEFEVDTKELFSLISKGLFFVFLSETTLRELDLAPQHVQKIIELIPSNLVETIQITDEIINLRDKYIKAGILGKSSINDAEHIASASVFALDFVISWNFKHIVHYDKINGYQAINLFNGYKPINIYSPKEIV